MIVREFEKTDKKTFFELCECFYAAEATLRSYDEVITEKTFLRIMDKHENLWGYLLIDKDHDAAVGYALLTSYWSNEEGGEVIVLDEIFIRPIDRNKGYAKIFMNWIEEEFKNAAAITLEVLNTNQKACELYSKAGYKPDGYITYTKALKNKN